MMPDPANIPAHCPYCGGPLQITEQGLDKPHFPRPPWWFGFEYRSTATFFGLALVHVAFGYNPHTGLPRVACGIIAIGNFSVGLVSIGGIALGGLVFSGIGLGLMVLAGIAIGWLAVGGIAAGVMYALGGLSISLHQAIGGLPLLLKR